MINDARSVIEIQISLAHSAGAPPSTFPISSVIVYIEHNTWNALSAQDIKDTCSSCEVIWTD